MKRLLIVLILFFSYTTYSQTAEEYFNKGIDKEINGDMHGAIDYYNKAIKKAHKDSILFTSALYVEIGRKQLQLKEYKGALDSFNKSWEINPGLLDISLIDEIKTKFKAGLINEEEIPHQLEHEMVNIPKYTGLAKSGLKDYRGAIEDFNIAIEVNPEDFMIYYLRGISKLALKDFDGSCTDIRIAANMAPHGPNIPIEDLNSLLKFCNANHP